MVRARRGGVRGLMRERPVIARGTVRVDSRAAQESLRLHQLEAPVLYVLELLRAAFAGGATRVAMENDADDFALTFDGEALDADALAGVLTFLLNREHKRLRLMAVAVNTALGLSPAYVDLYTARHDARPPAEGTVARVRWSPNTAPGEPLDGGVVEHVARPAAMGDATMRVHVHESFGVAVLREWFRAVPAETDLLRTRVWNPPVPVRVGDRDLLADAPREALVRVPIEPTGDVRGVLELVDPRGPRCNTLLLCERGVSLDVTPLRDEVPGATLPLRLVLDADHWETNASRSKVTRTDALRALVRRVFAAAVPALADAAFACAQRSDADAEAVIEALAAWARYEVGDEWPRALAVRPEPAEAWVDATPVSVLARVFETPLLPLVGEPAEARVSLRAVAAWSDRAVWRQPAPPPSALAPWLQHVVWVRDDRPALFALLAPLAPASAAEAVARARDAQERHARHVQQPASQPVAQLEDLALRVAFSREGARGELAVSASGLARRGPVRLTPWILSRPFIPVERAFEGFVVAEAAVEGAGLTVTPAWNAVSADARLDEAIAALRVALLEGIAALVAHWSAPLADDDPRAPWIGPAADEIAPAVRARVVRAWWGEALAGVAPTQRSAVIAQCCARHPALANTAAWETARAGVVRATTEVLRQVQGTGRALLVAPPGARGVGPGGREVLCVDDADRATLAALAGDAPVVDYGDLLGARTRGSLLDRIDDAAKALLPHATLDGDGARVLALPALQAGRGTLTVVHRGATLGTVSHGAKPPLALVLDDEGAVPAGPGRGVVPGTRSPEAERLLRDAPAAVARAALAWARDRVWNVSDPDGERAEAAVLRLLLGVLRAKEHGAVHAAIESSPWVPVFGEGDVVRRVSLASLRGRNEASVIPLPSLAAVPVDVDGAGFDAVILPTRDLAALWTEATGIPLLDASTQIPSRKSQRTRRLARAALERRARLDDPTLATLGAQGPVAVFEGSAGRISVAPAPADGARVQVTVGGVVALDRADVPMPVPVVARVELTHERALRNTLDALTDTGRAAVEALLDGGCGALVDRVCALATERDPGDAARAMVCAWVLRRGARRARADASRYAALASAPLWPSPDGARRTLDAIEGEIMGVRDVPASWLGPTRDEPADPPWICVRDGAMLRALGVIANRATRDATAEAQTLQRIRRLRGAGAGRVRLPGSPAFSELALRIEAHRPAFGVGELRLVEGPPRAIVTLFHRGESGPRVELNAPFAMHVALEAPQLDPARAATGFVALDPVPTLVELATVLLARVPGTAAASWAPLRRALRWWLLHATEVTAAMASLPVFEDSAARPCTLDDLRAQQARFGRVAWASLTLDAPCEPYEPGRRVVMLAADEARWLAARMPSADHGDTLRRDVSARRWERLAPCAEIVWSASVPSGAVRVAVREEGLTGEVVLVPPDAPSHTGARVVWYAQRRPLGEERLDAAWPALVSAEAADTQPDDDRLLLRRADGYSAACESVRRAVLAALSSVASAPDDALAAVSAHDPRSPRSSRSRAGAVGALWLSRDPSAEGTLDVRAFNGRHTVASALSDGRPAPVCGTLWIARDVDTDEELQRTCAALVTWAWRACVEQLLERDDVAPAVWARAALHGVLSGGRLKAWARAHRAPNSALTWERIAAASKRPLRLLAPGDAPHPDGVPDDGAPWVRMVRASGHVRAAPEAPAPSEPIVAPTQNSTHPRAPVATVLRAMLGARAPKVRDDDGPASARDPLLRYVPQERAVVIAWAHPAVQRLVADDARAAARMLSLAALAALRRANVLTAEAEADAVSALLRAAATSGR